MSEKNDLKTKTVSNLFWRFAERCGAQGVAFVVSIVLARMLSPEDYGLIALVTVFTSILQVFVDNGLGNALIQKKDADDMDFSTAFYANVAFCLVLYIIAYLAAPLVAKFYNNDSLTGIFRVLCLTVLISGVKNIQQAYVSRKMIFRKFFFATLIGTIGAAVIGIFMAYHGYGAWALVAQQVFNTLIDTIVLWISVKWRPKRMFSMERLKVMFNYGWKLLASSLITTIYNDIRQLIIGRVYSAEDLAYYNKGKQFSDVVVVNINASIDSVLLPVLSENQDDKTRVRELTRRSIKISSYIMWPLMFGLMAVGEPFIELILTEKWLPCVPYLYIFCFTNGIMPIQTANLNAIKAMGRSDLYLKLEIIKKTGGILLILAFMNQGVLALGISCVIYSLYAGLVNTYPNKKLLGYSVIDQLKDILPAFGLSAAMAVIVYYLPLGSLHLVLQLIIKVIVGAAIYVGGSVLFKIDSFRFVWGIVKNFLKR